MSHSVQKQKVERYSRRYEEIRRRPWQVPRMTRSFYGTVKIRSAVAAQRTGINDQTVERMEEFLSSATLQLK